MSITITRNEHYPLIIMIIIKYNNRHPKSAWIKNGVVRSVKISGNFFKTRIRNDVYPGMKPHTTVSVFFQINVNFVPSMQLVTICSVFALSPLFIMTVAKTSERGNIGDN